MIALEGTQITNADEFMRFLRLPENESRQFELVEGVIVEMAGGTGGRHGEVTLEISLAAGNFVKVNRLGRITGAETCYRLYVNPAGRATVRCPDFAFVSYARSPEPLPADYIPFAPDLAVEVVSPGNDASELHNKVLDYLKYGTKLVWLIYPASRTLTVYTQAGATTLTVDDTLDGGDVLPGFSLPVRDIFPV